MPKKEKAKVGFYGITGCAGCLLSVIFNEDEILDIVNAVDIVAFPLIKGKNSEEPLDICFLEGSIASKDDLEIAQKLRKRSKVMIALGTCACEGNIPSLKNFTNKQNLKKYKFKKNPQNQDMDETVPLHKVIDVEYSLPGCPPDRDEIKTFIKEILLGKTFRLKNDPVCSECRLNDNGCLLDKGILCMGSMSRAGCHAVCPTAGQRCYGCRGLTDDANFEEFFRLLKEKGFKELEIKKFIETYISIDVNEKLKGTKWGKLH